MLAALLCRDGRAFGIGAGTVIFGLIVPLGLRFGQARTEPVRSERKSIRVMTYNILHGQRGMEGVADAIRREHPDIVCFQESSPWGRFDAPQAELKRLLPGYHWVLRTETSLASQFPIRETRLLPLPPAPQSLAAVEAVLDVEGRRVTVVCVHLTPGGYAFWPPERLRGLPADIRRAEAARAEQITRLLAATGPVTTPLLVCGDFNLPPQGIAYRRLTSRFQDAFAEVGRGFGYTLTDAWPVKRVDYVLTANGAWARRVWVPAVRASDHRPVVADIAVSE